MLIVLLHLLSSCVTMVLLDTVPSTHYSLPDSLPVALALRFLFHFTWKVILCTCSFITRATYKVFNSPFCMCTAKPIPKLPAPKLPYSEPVPKASPSSQPLQSWWTMFYIHGIKCSTILKPLSRTGSYFCCYLAVNAIGTIIVSQCQMHFSLVWLVCFCVWWAIWLFAMLWWPYFFWSESLVKSPPVRFICLFCLFLEHSLDFLEVWCRTYEALKVSHVHVYTYRQPPDMHQDKMCHHATHAPLLERLMRQPDSPLAAVIFY